VKDAAPNREAALLGLEGGHWGPRVGDGEAGDDTGASTAEMMVDG
jgi:hypothetical protein